MHESQPVPPNRPQTAIESSLKRSKSLKIAIKVAQNGSTPLDSYSSIAPHLRVALFGLRRRTTLSPPHEYGEFDLNSLVALYREYEFFMWSATHDMRSNS